jgi:hypothetical protein
VTVDFIDMFFYITFTHALGVHGYYFGFYAGYICLPFLDYFRRKGGKAVSGNFKLHLAYVGFYLLRCMTIAAVAIKTAVLFMFLVA